MQKDKANRCLGKFSLNYCKSRKLTNKIILGICVLYPCYLFDKNILSYFSLQIDDWKNINHIAQNVPTCTAQDYADEVKKFWPGKLEMSDCLFLKQDNTVKTVVERSKERINPEDVAVLYIQNTGKHGKRKFIWGPLLKNEDNNNKDKLKLSSAKLSSLI